MITLKLSKVQQELTCMCSLLVINLLVYFFSLNPQSVLNHYSQGVYPVSSVILRWLSSIFPFALGDICYVLLFLLLCRTIFILIKEQQSFTVKYGLILVIKILNLLLLLFLAFKLLWGLNYDRPRISKQLNLSEKKYDVKELVLLTDFFVNRINELVPKIAFNKVYTIQHIRRETIAAYTKMATKDLFFQYKTPALKPAISSTLVSKMGIEGYFNPLSGEANLNMNLPEWVLPFVACHEVSHQLGVAKEDEANLVGYLTAINSDDLNFQYSANYAMLRYLLYETAVKSPEDYIRLYKKLSPAIIQHFKAETIFWRKNNSQMSGYMNIAFDRFLKFNRQKKGIKSYQNIVIWLWNYHHADIEKR